MISSQTIARHATWREILLERVGSVETAYAISNSVVVAYRTNQHIFLCSFILHSVSHNSHYSFDYQYLLLLSDAAYGMKARWSCVDWRGEQINKSCSACCVVNYCNGSLIGVRYSDLDIVCIALGHQKKQQSTTSSAPLGIFISISASEEEKTKQSTTWTITRIAITTLNHVSKSCAFFRWV